MSMFSQALGVTIGPYTVEFIAVEYDTPASDQSTWYYRVVSTEAGGAKAISHVTFELSGCVQIVDAGTWNGDVDNIVRTSGDGIPEPGTFPAAPQSDPLTGLMGLKFDQPFPEGNDQERFYFFTVDGNYQSGLNKVGIKAGSSDPGDFEADITGPNDDCTLPVTLGYIRAEQSGETIDFIWQTATETGTAGFNVLAEVGNERVQLNNELIPSKVIDSLTPTNYSFSAVTDASVYFLEEVALDGKISSFGPYEIGVEYGSYAAVDDVTPSIFLPVMRR